MTVKLEKMTGCLSVCVCVCGWGGLGVSLISRNFPTKEMHSC